MLSLLITCVIGLCAAQDSDARARAALALADLNLPVPTPEVRPAPRPAPTPEPCKCGADCNCGKGSVCDCIPTYSKEVKAEAIKKNLPLIVYVNEKAKPVNGALVCIAKEYGGSAAPGIVRLYPKDGKLWETLPVQQNFQPQRMLFQQRPTFFTGMGGSCVGGG